MHTYIHTCVHTYIAYTLVVTKIYIQAYIMHTRAEVIRHNYEEMEAQKTQYMIATEKQKVIEKGKEGHLVCVYVSTYACLYARTSFV
jgi:hypothetical protein